MWTVVVRCCGIRIVYEVKQRGEDDVQSIVAGRPYCRNPRPNLAHPGRSRPSRPTQGLATVVFRVAVGSTRAQVGVWGRGRSALIGRIAPSRTESELPSSIVSFGPSLLLPACEAQFDRPQEAQRVPQSTHGSLDRSIWVFGSINRSMDRPLGWWRPFNTTCRSPPISLDLRSE